MNRHIPFGYCIKIGELQVNKLEADVVEYIYSQYIQGSSYQKITDELSKSDVPYSKKAPKWNKNMVKRILENTVYTGVKGYPLIISSGVFSAVKALREQRAVTYPNKDIGIIKRLMRCESCDNKLQREVKYHPTRWICNKCSTAIRKNDDEIKDAIRELITYLTENTDIIEIPSSTYSKPQNLEITRLSNEINREIDRLSCNEDKVKSMILACAAAKYHHSENNSLTNAALDIKSKLNSHCRDETGDITLLEQIAKGLIIKQDGNITVRLTTGQLINLPERKD